MKYLIAGLCFLILANVIHIQVELEIVEYKILSMIFSILLAITGVVFLVISFFKTK